MCRAAQKSRRVAISATDETRSAEGAWLAGGLENGEPEVAARLDLIAMAHRERHRDVNEPAVPPPTTIAVRPAMAACTAFCASLRQ